ncbi:MAG TPA: sodium:solute symporter family protein [Bryobacteraceae bacterium]|nr:sodium:solute symporter family protein [Bryobacteraceae bacterium]
MHTSPDKLLSLAPIDLVVIGLYFVVVLGIGLYLRRYTTTGEDFFLAGRDMSSWVAGLSFVAANLGSLELMGWAGSAYQYGILAAHWYWIGAIPAMLFLALVMMPFYYISRTHSVPGYLQLRFGEPSRALSAVTFGFMTVLMSGINMYSMALVMKIILGWDIGFSIWISSLTVAAYVFLGGLLSAIFNEVLQFFLIWLGAVVVSILGLVETGGWDGMVRRIATNFPGKDYTHMWQGLGSFTSNPMGIHWIGIVFGLGFVISFGYWTTDFLVVQRVLSARDLRSAKMAPIIGSYFKMAVPFIVILPGLLGLAVLPEHLVGETLATPGSGLHTYNEVLPLMLARYCGPGLLGLGITALVAGFMSGMAGNVSAFATVWTYDIYRPFMKKNATDAHYVAVGRWCTIVGVLVSIGAAYLVMQFASIMDYVQALFSFFIAPLFGTVILGMLWKRATPQGGFWGLLIGTVSSVAMWAWVKADPTALRYIALSPFAKDMAENMYRALWSWLICVAVTVIVSLLTTPKPDSELVGLVYGATEIPSEGKLAWYQRTVIWAALAFVLLITLNVIFW